MATPYEAWAKYDVDAELERVDAQAQREEARRVSQQQKLAKQSVENAVSSSAEQSAQVLAAHAAVAALKVKARAKKKKQEHAVSTAALAESHEPQLASNQREAGESLVERLQRQSDLFKTKHELIKRIMTCRREGEAILQDEKRRDADTERALKLFGDALASARELEKIVPDLVEAEQLILNSDGGDAQSSESNAEKCSSGAKPGGKGQQPHSEHHHDGHACGGDASQCSHHTHAETEEAAKKKKKNNDALPKANDLSAILKMFFKDVFMGVGTCHLQLSRLAVASDAFKEVLLRDDAYVPAWVERGSAFERMGASLLAMLHFSRAVDLDPQDENAKESLERVKGTLLSGLDDIIDAEAIERKIVSCTQSSSPPASLASILSAVHLTFREANVLMVEGFFQYAIPKFQIVLGCIEFVVENPGLSAINASDIVAEVQAALHQMRTACYLNIAGGYHEMQRNQLKGVEYCEKVLESSSSGTSGAESPVAAAVQSICHFRIGQLLRSAHDYERAMEHLVLSRRLVTTPQSSEQQQQQQGALKKIDKEIDRCGFERSQHDLAFIRSLLLAEQNASASTSSRSS